MERHINFSAITSYDLLTNERFIVWMLYPDEQLNKYWNLFQQLYPESVAVIARIRSAASDLILSEQTDARVLLPCG